MSNIPEAAVEPQTDIPASPEVSAETDKRWKYAPHPPRNWAWQQGKDLTAAQHRLLLAYAEDRNGVTWKDAAYYAEMLGCDQTSIERHRAQLVAKGKLVAYRRVRNRKRLSDLTVLTVPRGEKLVLADVGKSSGFYIGKRVSRLKPPDWANIVEACTAVSRDTSSSVDRSSAEACTAVSRGPVVPHLEQHTSRSRRSNPGVARAPEPEPETTTTTAATLDVGTMEDAEELLEIYEDAVEGRTGRRPRRQPKDILAARAMAPTVGWEEFGQVCDWAIRDPFSRDKGGSAKGLAHFAERYDSIAGKRAEMPETYCCECGAEERLDSEEQREYERHGVHICRACKADGKYVIQ